MDKRGNVGKSDSSALGDRSGLGASGLVSSPARRAAAQLERGFDMDSALPLVTVVCSIPDDGTLASFHGALFRVLRGLEGAYRFEILYSDANKSGNETSAIDALAQLDPRIHRLSSPAGDSDALLRAGLAQAGGVMILLLHGGIHSPELLPRLLDLAKGPCAWVEGVPQGEPAANRWPRWLQREQASKGPSCLLLKRAALDALRKPGADGKQVRERLYAEKLPRAELTYAPPPRAATAPTAPLLRRVIADVFTMWKTTPFTLLVYFGGMVFLVGVFLALWFLLRGAIAPNTVWFSWCYLIVVLHILGGGILVAVGKLGAMMTRIFEKLQQLAGSAEAARPPQTLALRPPSRDAA